MRASVGRQGSFVIASAPVVAAVTVWDFWRQDRRAQRQRAELIAATTQRFALPALHGEPNDVQAAEWMRACAIDHGFRDWERQFRQVDMQATWRKRLWSQLVELTLAPIRAQTAALWWHRATEVDLAALWSPLAATRIDALVRAITSPDWAINSVHDDEARLEDPWLHAVVWAFNEDDPPRDYMFLVAHAYLRGAYRDLIQSWPSQDWLWAVIDEVGEDLLNLRNCLDMWARTARS